MNIMQFVGEQDEDRHGGPLAWPGFNGLPVRGEVPRLATEKELDERAITASSFQFRIFELENPEHLRTYLYVMTRAVSTEWFAIYREEFWRDKDNNQRVSLWWLQRYAEFADSPSNVHSGGV